MEKIYRLMSWIDMQQALHWLKDMTSTQITERDLLQLCESGECGVYADVDGLTGQNWSDLTDGVAKGIHLVKNPMNAFASEWEPRTLLTFGDIFGVDACCEWLGDLPPWKRGPIFKPVDISNLAAKINGDQGSAPHTDEPPKPSHLLTIAVLLELLKAPVDYPRPQGMNQEAIKNTILERFPMRGLSDRNLQAIFAAANKAMSDAE